MTAAELANRFDIPGALRIEPEPGGLTRVVISTPAAEADLYLQGAHLAHWTPRGQRPVLFVSPKSLFAAGKAIRGGYRSFFPGLEPGAMASPVLRMASREPRSGPSKAQDNSQTAG